MNGRYGEIARFRVSGVAYIIEAEKEYTKIKECELPYIPFIYFLRTTKTAKNSGCDKRTKESSHFSLEKNTFNQKIIKMIIEKIERYINEWNITWLCFSIYGERSELTKRMMAYHKILRRLGFLFVHVEEDTGIYYYRKKDTVC